MNKSNEELFVERFGDFRNIIKRSRTVLAEQTAVDIFLISSLVFELFVSIANKYASWTLSLICVFLLLTRMFIILFVRGHKGNYIGMGLAGLLFLLLLLSGSDNIFELSILCISVFLQIRRIYRISASDKVKQIYGAPGFNGYVTYNELGSDPLLKKRVFEQVNEATENASVRYALRCIHNSNGLSGARVLSAAAVAAGLLMAGNVAGTISRYEHASPASSINAENMGRYFKYTVDKVYNEISVGVDSSTDSEFLVSINGSCLLVRVPHEFHESFKSSEEYWSDQSTAKLSGMDDFISDNAGPSAKPITVTGTLTDSEEAEKDHIEFLKKKIDMKRADFDIGDDELIYDYSIQVINIEHMKKIRASGFLIVFIGAAGVLLTNALFFKRSYEPEYLIFEEN